LKSNRRNFNPTFIFGFFGGQPIAAFLTADGRKIWKMNLYRKISLDDMFKVLPMNDGRGF